MFIASLWLTLAQAQDHTSKNDPSKSRTATTDDASDNSNSDDITQKKDELWIDHVQYALSSTVDATARWVDRFFADPRYFDDRPVDKSKLPASIGRFMVGPRWDQADGWDEMISFRARHYLPHMNRRFSAVIGRLGFDEFISGDDSNIPALIRTPDTDNEWLIGFGYDPLIRDQHKLSLGAGFRGGFSFDPYLRTRYLLQSDITNRSQIRSQSVGFWRHRDGFGISQRLDYEIAMGDRWLGRWSGRGTFAQHTDGVRWRTSANLFYLYSRDRAYAGEIWALGETAHLVPLRDYGFRGIYRQRYLREWFFIEPWVGMHWPREELNEKRKSSWIVGLQFEIIFGEIFMRRAR